ncbi:MAG: sensor histidine kinase [Crocinitomicaceae bacterium]|nr:sensor histidine kinase [Crocinitomicaceae bacterium]MBK8924966.1 sensor histidine kinase [Crocinitomicaceae bacterium]
MKWIPDAHFDNYYDSARYKLVWRITLLLFIMLPFLWTTLLITGDTVAIPAIIAWALNGIILFVLYKSRNYRLSAFIFSLIGTTFCSGILLGYPQIFHYVDSFWMMVLILFTYFTLGKFWGNIILIVNLTAVIVFILFFLNYSLSMINHLQDTELISKSIDVLICGSCMAFMIFQFLSTTQYAENNFKKANADLQRRNEEVANQNQEKTVMLREIHHRVKNNLQVITSLLRLQSRDAKDFQTIEMFKDSTNRVVAMALIHEKMYQSKDLAKINLEEYLKSLLADLVDSYAVDIPLQTKIYSNLEHVTNKSLVPLALLFNEMVSNSLKHAFTGRSYGSIHIHIEKQNGQVVIMYEDDGTWKEKQKQNSFGLELIETLTEQLDGKYTRLSGNGTKYEFTLPDNL